MDSVQNVVFRNITIIYEYSHAHIDLHNTVMSNMNITYAYFHAIQIYNSTLHNV
jgi:hypothetical protein